MSAAAKDWLRKAIAAGMEPTVAYQPDGRRGLCTVEIGVTDRPYAPTPETLSEIVALIETEYPERVFKAPPPPV